MSTRPFGRGLFYSMTRPGAASYTRAARETRPLCEEPRGLPARVVAVYQVDLCAELLHPFLQLRGGEEGAETFDHSVHDTPHFLSGRSSASVVTASS